MGESNGAWGELAAHDDELAELWDSFDPIPHEAGVNAALDAFLARKHLSAASLVRIGARLAEHTVLAFAGPGWMKFRDVVTDKRWVYAGSDWSRLKLVPHGVKPTPTVIVVEGETDGARCSEVYACDVAIMPAGARFFPTTYAEQLAGYEQVLIGLDDDSAGEQGAQLIREALPGSVRFTPPANDWCEATSFPPIPAITEARVLVPAGELLDYEPPEVVSWFENGLLPISGQLMLHGWAKSFKSFLALDMLAALAQCQDWCSFEPTEEPCKVAVMQYEIPWAYYQHRVKLLLDNARDPELFKQNFLTFTPMQRPRFTAGVTKHEDWVLTQLEKAGVQVFLLDPARRATGMADLNSEKDVRPLLRFFERLQDNGITVICCHHDNKSYSRTGGGDPLGMTGVGAFAGDCDTIVSVSVPKGYKVDQPYRNLHFTIRNAPSVAPRSMEMTEDGRIIYGTSMIGDATVNDGPAI